MHVKSFTKIIVYPCIKQVKKFKEKGNMHTFTQKFNPITGKNEWIMQPENYDFLQEIARSSYGDMLHDTERNHLYFLAIKSAIEKVKKEGRIAKVLDIGTGTGLLSMMAAVSGADTIYACEAFQPVAKCAINVLKDNKLDHKITIIPKQSSELIVGKDGDLPERANILVTEVFDTELIGEGALSTFQHAISELLDENSVVVPSSATIYAQVIESEFISSFNKLKPFHINEQNVILPPSELDKCPGAAAVHDIQMKEIPKTSFKLITDPIPVFHFDFTGKCPLKTDENTTKIVNIIQKGQCEAVFMWWDLQMFDTLILSCAPIWRHPEPSTMQWRDHWMQAIYYLPKSLSVNQGDKIHLQAYHDEFSLWFNVLSLNSLQSTISHPVCDCMLHCTNSRTRVGMLNDPIRRKKYLEIFNKLVCTSSVCLSIGDLNYFTLIAASLGAKVFSIEQDAMYRNINNSILKHNQKDVVLLDVAVEDLKSSDLNDEKIDILFAEPYFMFGLLPWDSLFHFWHKRSLLDKVLSKHAQFSPEKASIKAVVVELKDLWKIRAPVIEAEGFDLSSFDKMTQEAISLCDNRVEPHALWEYPSKPLSDVFELMSCDLSKCVESDVIETCGTVEISCEGHCNGIAIWVDYTTENITITTGPTEPLVRDKNIVWDIYTRQGIYFLQPSTKIENLKQEQLSYKMKFNPKNMDITFDFQIQKTLIL